MASCSLALKTPTPPPIGDIIDKATVKPVSMDKILMVETENVKDESYEYNDQMKVSVCCECLLLVYVVVSVYCSNTSLIV